MTREIRFKIPGEPQGKARARVVRLKNGITSSYTPDASVSYENLIKLCFQDAVGPHFCPLPGLFSVSIDAYFSPPASKPKVWKVLALVEKVIRPGKKPDWDNIGKQFIID